ncbi:hypothetical protein ACFQY7_07210 [Actinomadura luteofluorescens]|uniref:hypothetical protein n=1 Tax=Actinomadura luteofluorescens TaxID=46163 RepID=UPI003638CC06
MLGVELDEAARDAEQLAGKAARQREGEPDERVGETGAAAFRIERDGRGAARVRRSEFAAGGDVSGAAVRIAVPAGEEPRPRSWCGGSPRPARTRAPTSSTGRTPPR